MTARLRVTVGVGVLAAGVFFCGAGGALAVADPGSQTSVSNGPGTAGTADAHTQTATDTMPTSLRQTADGIDAPGITATQSLTAGIRPGVASNPVLNTDDSSPSDDESGVDPATASALSEVSAAEDDVASTPTAISPMPEVVAPETALIPQPMIAADTTIPVDPAPRRDTSRPLNTGSTPASTSAPDLAGSTQAATTDASAARFRQFITSIEDVAAAVDDAARSIPALLASLPTSPTPITDVITAIQNMLTSVATAAAPLMWQPSDLASMFLTATGGPALTARTPAAHPPAPVVPGVRTPTVPAPTAPAHQVAVPSASDRTAPAALDLVAALTLDHTGASAPAVSKPRFELTGGLPSYLNRIAHTLLVPVSLWALVTTAVPGIAGLLTFGLAGTRIGYRQAKANFALRTSAIARFAGTGPLGVVNSDSLITLRSRTAHAAGRAGYHGQAA